MKTMPSSKKTTMSSTLGGPALPNEQSSEEMIEDLDEALEVIPYTYTITAYGADYPVDSVVKRIEAADILVPTFMGT